jgi:hypothetical protein
MILDPTKKYSRKQSIVYDENDIPIIKFNSYLPDFAKLSVEGINYMNRYFKASPEKFEVFNQDDNNTNQQLELFEI